MKSIFCGLSLALFLVGCATTELSEPANLPPDPQRRSWTNVSLLKTNLSIGAFNAMANDRNRSQFDRGQAVCTLFANHIKPGMDSKTVQKILKNAKWLDEAEVSGIYALAGWVPLDLDLNTTQSSLMLFRIKDQSGWKLWLLFDPSGFVDGNTVPKNERIDRWFPEYREYGSLELDTIAFLTGRWKIQGSPRLKEFTIDYPEAFFRNKKTSFYEHFTIRGMTRYSY